MASSANGYPDVYFGDRLLHLVRGPEDSNGSAGKSDDSDHDESALCVSQPLSSKKRPENGTNALPSQVDKVAAKKKPDTDSLGSPKPKAPPILLQHPPKAKVNTTPSTQAFGSGSSGYLKPQRLPPYQKDIILPTQKARFEKLNFNDRTFWLKNFMDIPPEISRAIAAKQSVADIGSTLVPVMADVDDSIVEAVWQDLKVSNEKIVHNASTLYKKRDGKWRVTGQIRARNLTVVQAKGLRLRFPQSLYADPVK